MWDALRLDVRHSFRSLRRAPTFSLIVIFTLALAVGATAALGSLLNALVLRRLAVPGPEQLVAVSALEPRANVGGYFYADTFNAYRATQRSFAQMSMYSDGGLRVETQSGVLADASIEAVSATYFDIVGARLASGRFFTESDNAVVVITDGFRRRIFGDGPGVGQAITVNAVPVTVIGVVADGFHGLQIHGTTDLILPFAVTRAATGDVSRPFRSRVVVGRSRGTTAWGNPPWR
jgi:ABC-type antimicrobial peptide transport system permease subunit